MNAADPIILAVLATVDLLVLIGFRRRQALRYQRARIHDALVLAVRREIEQDDEPVETDSERLSA